jgi:hypothetical protein
LSIGNGISKGLALASGLSNAFRSCSRAKAKGPQQAFSIDMVAHMGVQLVPGDAYAFAT